MKEFELRVKNNLQFGLLHSLSGSSWRVAGPSPLSPPPDFAGRAASARGRTAVNEG
jgi:hypothetical protein